jgi:hypothetical protein
LLFCWINMFIVVPLASTCSRLELLVRSISSVSPVQFYIDSVFSAVIYWKFI